MKYRPFVLMLTLPIMAFLTLIACQPKKDGKIMPPFPKQGESYVSEVWVSDQGNGTFNNPVLYADYF